MADPLVGRHLGRYRIDGLLGRGGMGRVYAATHEHLGRRVAIKLLSPELAAKREYVTRFFNEARAAAALQHDNIIDVLDIDTLEDGRAYMVLEYLEGETLAAFLRREGPLTPGAALEILRPICSAIGAAHARSIIHRDLKPANVYLARRPGGERVVKVLDFGVAKLRDGERVTRSGTVLGTPVYMSPEQALARHDAIGPESDVYSLGVMAYEMLAGRPPFDGSSGELVIQHAQTPPPALSQVGVIAARPQIELVLRKALAKSPPARWRRVELFSRALSLAIDGSGDAELESLLGGFTGDGAARAGAAVGAARAGRRRGRRPGDATLVDGETRVEPRLRRWRRRGGAVVAVVVAAAAVAVAAVAVAGLRHGPRPVSATRSPSIAPLAAPVTSTHPATPGPPPPTAVSSAAPLPTPPSPAPPVKRSATQSRHRPPRAATDDRAPTYSKLAVDPP